MEFEGQNQRVRGLAKQGVHKSQTSLHKANQSYASSDQMSIVDELSNYQALPQSIKARHAFENEGTKMPSAKNQQFTTVKTVTEKTKA